MVTIRNTFLKHIIVLFTLSFLFGCSSSERTIEFNATSDFNSENYINPEKYGHELEMRSKDSGKASADSAFKPASMNGGYPGLQKHIGYPSKAVRKGIHGKVILRVYVDSTGTLTNIETIQSPDKLLTQASAKALIDSKYKAATLNGEPVNSFLHIPIVFRSYTIKISKFNKND